MLLGSMLAPHHDSPSRVSLTLLVTTEIEGREAVVADGQLLGGRVCGRLQDGDTVVLLNILSANKPHTTSSSSYIRRAISKLPGLCNNPKRPEPGLVASGIEHQRAGSYLPNLNTNSPSTCAAVLSCRHCLDRGREAWRAY